MHLEKNRTYACTFPVQRKEINVVKVRFTMRYSSRKLSNDKVITTACNFWRQIACSFQAMSGNILFLGNKIFEIPPFFQTRPGDLGKKAHACSLRFSALKVFSVLTRGNESLLKCLSVSRTVSHLIMRNNKPTFAYNLALQSASYPGPFQRIRERLGFWFHARYHGKAEPNLQVVSFLSFTLSSVLCVHV